MKTKDTNNGRTDLVTDVLSEGTSRELVRLIRKLRWIGMETEAARLQGVLRNVPPDRRASLLASPHSTD
jgi:hypothetical protein